MARRIRIYLFGVILGCIIVYSSLIKDRSKELLGWMPGAKVLTELRAAHISYSEKVKCQLNCLNSDITLVDNILENGDVDFSASDHKSSPKKYTIEGMLKDQELELVVFLQDTSLTIDHFNLGSFEENCICK